ncbi:MULTISPECIES: hypothetical protein [unclassified Pyramidobacter]|uniref:hypothetical protein n=1 Tax=unclassified Pyramidobacter TaxID=2632171 RepID=UPI00098ECEDA|nr:MULTISPECIES: hypothetical protein [unclassified Pyramidobacter]OON89045.1 hypothetical protein B0D78_05380 [Pyramidobacter sp. C12-8]RKJ79476.1 hypothetical protein D7D26_04835 [Pyramidobacter sp. CG50-2]WOL39484.1 hypothetical protein RAH42_10095 [Pyramidobacter sp. YE332]
MKRLAAALFLLAALALPAPAAPDIDLAAMGRTMLFAAVYDIKNNPESYLGRRIKMTGQFAIIQGADAQGQPDPDKIFYNCVIPMAQNSLEFGVAGELYYPEDFPDLEAPITVEGVYEKYEDNGTTYYRVGQSAIDF